MRLSFWLVLWSNRETTAGWQLPHAVPALLPPLSRGFLWLTQLPNASSPTFCRARRKELLPSSPSALAPTVYILLLSISLPKLPLLFFIPPHLLFPSSSILLSSRRGIFSVLSFLLHSSSSSLFSAFLAKHFTIAHQQQSSHIFSSPCTRPSTARLSSRRS